MRDVVTQMKETILIISQNANWIKSADAVTRNASDAIANLIFEFAAG